MLRRRLSTVSYLILDSANSRWDAQIRLLTLIPKLIMKFEYPVALSGDEDKAPKFLKGASNRTGYFPVGRLNTWHGGIHFEGDRAIRAIADGKIIAFRVPKTYLTETVNGRTARYSNGFVLIQHEYESPNGQQLTFYSFYNHLLALEEMKGVKIPDIFKGERYKVKATANDSLKVGGVRIRQKAINGNVLAVAEKGTRLSGVTAVGEGGWLSVTYSTPQGKIIKGFTFGGSDEDDKWVDVVSGRVLVSKANGANGDKGALLRSEAKTGENIVCLMSPNSSVEIAPESQGKKGWLKVVNYGPDKLEGWCHDSGLEKEAIVILEEKMCDEVKEVCMDVKAGTIVGFAGYNGFENQTAYRAAHVEVFSSDEAIKDFLKNTKKDGENEQKFAKFLKGTEFNTAIPLSVRKDSKVKLLADSTELYQLVEVENIALTVSDRDEYLGYFDVKSTSYEFTEEYQQRLVEFKNLVGAVAKLGDRVKILEDWKAAENKETKDRAVEHINPAKGLVFWAKKDWIERKVITLPAVAEPAAVAFEAEVGEGIDPVLANLPAARDLGVVTRPTVEAAPETIEYDVINLDLSEVHLLNPEAEASNNKLEVDVVIDLKKGKEYKDDNGKVWRLLDFSDYRADGTLAAYKGLVKEDDLKDRFSAYDWAKFGFRILEDANNDYIFDFKERSDFFKEVCKLVDEDKNGILEPHELQSALNNPYTADKLSKLVCKHHNEWAYGGKHLSGLMSAVEKVFQKGVDLEKDEEGKKNLEELKKERMEAFKGKVKHMSIWEDIVPKEKGFWSSWFEGLLATSPPTAPGYWTFKGTRWVFEKVKEYFSDEVPLKPFPANQPVVYHFHPIAFVEGMKRIYEPVKNSMLCLYTQNGNYRPSHNVFGNVRTLNSVIRHQGVDILAKPDTEVFACYDGLVKLVGVQSGYGNVVVIEIEDVESFVRFRTNYSLVYKDQGEMDYGPDFNLDGSLYLFYSHLNEAFVSVGERVVGGQAIATSGTTGYGRSKDPHLHFEIRNALSAPGINNRCNPALFIPYKYEHQMTQADKDFQKLVAEKYWD